MSATWIDCLRTSMSPASTQALRLWDVLTSELPALPAPLVASRGDGGLQLVWDAGPAHVHVDVLRDGALEWFGLDRHTCETWGAEGWSADDVPRALVTELGLVIRHEGGDA